MSVSTRYGSICTVTETVAAVSALPSQRRVIHTTFNVDLILDANTTPPVHRCAHGEITIPGGGVASIDLTALPGTAGATVSLSGMRVVIARVRNRGSALMTVRSGGSNGHTGIFPAAGTPVQPGGHIAVYSHGGGALVASGERIWEIQGTAGQIAELTVVAG